MAYPTNPIYKFQKDPFTGQNNYPIKQEGSIKLSIPLSADNLEYQAYLAWVADGNTAEAAD